MNNPVYVTSVTTSASTNLASTHTRLDDTVNIISSIALPIIQADTMIIEAKAVQTHGYRHQEEIEWKGRPYTLTLDIPVDYANKDAKPIAAQVKAFKEAFLLSLETAAQDSELADLTEAGRSFDIQFDESGNSYTVSDAVKPEDGHPAPKPISVTWNYSTLYSNIMNCAFTLKPIQPTTVALDEEEMEVEEESRRSSIELTDIPTTIIEIKRPKHITGGTNTCALTSALWYLESMGPLQTHSNSSSSSSNSSNHASTYLDLLNKSSVTVADLRTLTETLSQSSSTLYQDEISSSAYGKTENPINLINHMSKNLLLPEIYQQMPNESELGTLTNAFQIQINMLDGATLPQVPDKLVTIGNNQYSLKSAICRLGAGTKIHYTALVANFSELDKPYYLCNDNTASQGNLVNKSDSVVAIRTAQADTFLKKATILYYEKISDFFTVD